MRSDLSGVIRKSSKRSSEVLVNHVAFAGYGCLIMDFGLEGKRILSVFSGAEQWGNDQKPNTKFQGMPKGDMNRIVRSENLWG